MGTVILYTSKHGATREIVNELSNKLKTDLVKIDLKETPRPDLSDYETIIIGGPVYAGNISGKLKKLCSENISLLKSKRIGLFLTGMTPSEQLPENIFEKMFGKDLSDTAKVKLHFGGIFNFEKMNFFEKIIVKKVSGIKHTTKSINSENISKFVETIFD